MPSTVSVIVPVYNQERYIKECVKSVLGQDYEALEVIVVDDGSTDRTPEILKEFEDRITIVRQENQGPASALNLGIRKAEGEFVAWLGSDDVYLDGAIQQRLKAFQNNPEAALVYTDYIIINQEGNPIRTVCSPSPEPGQFAKALLMGNFMNGSTVMVRKACHKVVGDYDETLKASPDGDMWFRFLQHGFRFVHLPIPLVQYRWHEKSTSHHFVLMQQCRDKVHQKALEQFWAQGLFSGPRECEELAYGFVRQFSFQAARLAIQKSLKQRFSLKSLVFFFSLAVMSTPFFLGARKFKGLACGVLKAVNIDDLFNEKDYWEKRLQKNWGLHGVGFLELGCYYNYWLYKVRKSVFFSLLKKLRLNVKELKILDIGSGTGFYLALWKSLNVKKVFGLDISSFSVSKLKERFPEFSTVQLDIGQEIDAQGFSERNFDLICAFDVLFHILNDQEFYQAFFNFSKLLSAGGYLIFSDNFLHGKTLRGKHQVSRSIENITSVLRNAGFRVICRVPQFVIMNAPVDTDLVFSPFAWKVMMRPVRYFPLLGYFYGALLFPLELFLIRVVKESMSTEVMVCQKKI